MPVRLTTGDRIAETSSKGNQEKWLEDSRWYKLDLFGYEGLAETVTSRLLRQTNVEELGFRYVTYRMERLEVHRRTRNGCSSPNFLLPGESILTLADLFRKGIGPHWQAEVARQPNLAGKVHWMAEQTIRLTGLRRFGIYLTLLFEVDMLFGNEDRHLNNIAVLRRGEGFDSVSYTHLDVYKRQSLHSKKQRGRGDISPRPLCLKKGCTHKRRGNSAWHCTDRVEEALLKK